MASRKAPNNEQAMLALLEYPTIGAAAKACGISETTLHRKLNDPVFRAEYDRRRTQIVESACTTLQGHMSEAAETLVKIMKDSRTGRLTRVNAAKAILEYGLRSVEISNILPRLEALEGGRLKADPIETEFWDE